MNFKRIFEEEQNSLAVSQNNNQNQGQEGATQNNNTTSQNTGDGKAFTKEQAQAIVEWAGFVSSEQRFCKNMNNSVTSIVNILNKGLQDKSITPEQKEYITKCIEYGQLLQASFGQLLESIGTKDTEGSMSNIINKAAETIKTDENSQNAEGTEQKEVGGNTINTPAIEDGSSQPTETPQNEGDDEDNPAGQGIEK